MRDSYNSCILEFLGHQIEDLLLSEHVNVSSRLIKDYNFVLSQNCAANANQLLFPHRHIVASFLDPHLQACIVGVPSGE